MLCGCPPFNGKNEKEIMERISVQPLDFSRKFNNKCRSADME